MRHGALMRPLEQLLALDGINVCQQNEQVESLVLGNGLQEAVIPV
ncbi:hypothetical protein [Pseudomonas sp. BIOMIG1BAC]